MAASIRVVCESAKNERFWNDPNHFFAGLAAVCSINLLLRDRWNEEKETNFLQLQKG
jgi:hypothetical protein